MKLLNAIPNLKGKLIRILIDSNHLNRFQSLKKIPYYLERINCKSSFGMPFVSL